ncbi:MULTISPECIES: hypothetical protein [unclassified Acetobacterium]|jgi:predicted metal-dependent phosphoesterase TrpH|uniref:hypothetical protein n=1 Tax=unclassified Acetobacterium TaxID=2638182 RepID=UPI000DBEC540|nr:MULTISPECIES: hypothetical protein [unclassified Acetobacterium]AWW26906.1 hypothetical protein DOZ58_09875 [Acetobacterium sp. KB-1]MDZ5726786.1 hypothetical protein [Acetobacterium sp. K1/6]
MKIRIGYVTNSSSTNFLILSKKELTPEYLFKKLGFKKGSIIEQHAWDLCENIINGTFRGLRYFDFDEMNYENVKEVFGEEAAEKYKKYKGKGFYTYMGYTSSDEDTLTSFFTTDTFELEENGIYINGRSCVW